MGQVNEPFRDFDNDHEQGNGIRACFASIQGWRQTQEDDHTVRCVVPRHKSLSYFAVFDGHGGSNVSQFAAETVIEIFSTTLAENTTDAETISQVLHDAVMKTDIRLTELDRSRFLQEGCTSIICVVTPTHVICANSGDSRAILVTLKNNGGGAAATAATTAKADATDDNSGASDSDSSFQVDALSIDQKPNNAQEQKRIEDAGMSVVDANGIFRVNGDLAVARAIGDFSFKNPDLPQERQAVSCEPEMKIVARNKDASQILVLACDGIWDVSSNEDTASFVAKELRAHGKLYTTAGLLVDQCLEFGSRDNMSVLLADLNSKFEFGPPPVYVPPPEDHEDNFGTPPRGATAAKDPANAD
jgi:serine/threonine protein phosphatase PrpC